jgi:hypothetical protein
MSRAKPMSAAQRLINYGVPPDLPGEYLPDGSAAFTFRLTPAQRKRSQHKAGRAGLRGMTAVK